MIGVNHVVNGKPFSEKKTLKKIEKNTKKHFKLLTNDLYMIEDDLRDENHYDKYGCYYLHLIG